MEVEHTKKIDLKQGLSQFRKCVPKIGKSGVRNWMPKIGSCKILGCTFLPERSRQGVGTGHESSNFAASHYLT